MECMKKATMWLYEEKTVQVQFWYQRLNLEKNLTVNLAEIRVDNTVSSISRKVFNRSACSLPSCSVYDKYMQKYFQRSWWIFYCMKINNFIINNLRYADNIVVQANNHGKLQYTMDTVMKYICKYI